MNGGIGPTPNWKNITNISTNIMVVIDIVVSELSRLKCIRHDMMIELRSIPTFYRFFRFETKSGSIFGSLIWFKNTDCSYITAENVEILVNDSLTKTKMYIKHVN